MEDQAQAVSQPAVDTAASAEPKTLAQALRLKFPGKYNNLSDTELEQATIAVHPEYATWPRTHVSSQEAIAAMHKVNDATAPTEKPTDLTDVAKRVAGGIASELNPVEMAKGVWNTVRHPIDTATGIAKASIDQGAQAIADAKQGRWMSAAGHAAGAFPVVGPAAHAIGEEMGRTGDVARGVGRGAALAGTVALPQAAEAAGVATKAVGETGVGAKVADTLATKGGEKIAKAITPVRGGGTAQFADMANAVGESLATDPSLGGITKPGFHAGVTTELDKAATALDTAADARLIGKTIYGAPIVQTLKDKLYNLTQAHPNAFAGQVGGETVDLPSGLARARAEQLRKGIETIEKLGPNIDYKELQKIRNDFDHTAKIGVYVTKPTDAVTAVTNKGSALGAADVAGDIREVLGGADPVTARANARYSMLRRADDVLEAQKISEQTRPTVGRRMLAAGLGAASGGFFGAVVLPMVDLALRSGPDAQLVAGRMMGQMAQMIRKGDTAGAEALAAKIQKMGIAGEAGKERQPQ